MSEDYILRLIQKKLLDPNVEITVEELKEAEIQIQDELTYIESRLAVIQSRQLILKRIIENDNLYKVTYH